MPDHSNDPSLSDREAQLAAREAALALWGLGVKAFSNLLVIVLNYLFSKLLIFQKPAGREQQ